jgi:LacI family transcriptional regulator
VSQKRSSRPTIADVAARAGVSSAAVSAVLNEARGNVRVSEQTRTRIVAAAAELGYSPDSAAQALRRRRSGLIGLIHRADRDSFAESAVSYRLGDNIARAAARRGYDTVDAAPARTRGGTRSESIDLLVSRRVEGVIIENPEHDELELLASRGLPVVQVLRPRSSVTASMLTVDPTDGFRQAVEHLAALGHLRIGFVGNGDPHPTDASRVRAFLDALAGAGIAPEEQTIQLGPDNRLETAYAATGVLLASARRPTAVIAAAESSALGVLRRLYAARLRVPDDVSVIGYDGVACAGLYPPLTSISQPLEALAAQAVELIADRAALRHLTLPAELVVRESTGPPPVDI